MERYAISAMKENLVTYGRTLHEQETDILWLDWTASTVEFTFCGTHLNASFRAEYGEEIEGMPKGRTLVKLLRKAKLVK